ncbi:hypothetical protein PV326_000333, partial [Microctonus aethiopoides]
NESELHRSVISQENYNQETCPDKNITNDISDKNTEGNINIRITSVDQPTVESSTQNIFETLISNSNKRKKDEQIGLESSIFQKTKNNYSSNVDNFDNISCNKMNTPYSRGHTLNNDNPPQSEVQYIPPPSLLPFEIYPNANKSTDQFTMMDISYSSLSTNNAVPMDRGISVSTLQCTPSTASQHQFDNQLLSGSETNNESSNDSSSNESSTEQNPGFAFEVVSMMSKGKITERDVAIQREIYKAMKRQLKHQKSMMHNRNEIYQIPKYHFDISDEMV